MAREQSNKLAPPVSTFVSDNTVDTLANCAAIVAFFSEVAADGHELSETAKGGMAWLLMDVNQAISYEVERLQASQIAGG